MRKQWLILLPFLAGCGGSGPGAGAPPPFIKDGVQGDDCVCMLAGLGLHKPAEGWAFQKIPDCALSGPGGVTVVLEAKTLPPGQPAAIEEAEWKDRLEDLRGQGYVVAEGPWVVAEPPSSGKVLAASKLTPKGKYDAIAEIRGVTGKAQVRLYVRGIWAAAKPPALRDGEARYLLDKVYRESLVRFEPMPPMDPGEDSLAIQALLDRWLSGLNRGDAAAYLACFHSESKALELEREVIRARSGNLFKTKFQNGAEPGPWVARRESLLVDGGEAVMTVVLERSSKKGDQKLQEGRLKAQLRREGTHWKILLWEALS